MTRHVVSSIQTEEEVEAETDRLGRRAMELIVLDWLVDDLEEKAALADAVGWEPGEDMAIGITARVCREVAVRALGGMPDVVLDRLRVMAGNLNA